MVSLSSSSRVGAGDLADHRFPVDAFHRLAWLPFDQQLVGQPVSSRER